MLASTCSEVGMFNGNLYGLIITMLTFVIAVVLAMRQVEQSDVHLELIIRPVSVAKLNRVPERHVDQGAPSQLAPETGLDERSSQHLAAKPRPPRTQ